jgi:polyribonucleotide nucleotidyltransferase
MKRNTLLKQTILTHNHLLQHQYQQHISKRYTQSYLYNNKYYQYHEKNNIKQSIFNHDIVDDYQTKDNLSFHNNIIGHLSESSIICSYGHTIIHASVNSTHQSSSSAVATTTKSISHTNVDTQLPMVVDYRNRYYSYGIIPETLNRREKHNNDDEILVARCIDRAVRPLFPTGFYDHNHTVYDA